MSSNDLFRMPNEIFDMNMRLSATELTVLAALYSLRGVCYKNKKYVRISQKAIATMTGLTPKTISRIIDKLNRLNLILEVRRYFVDEHKLGTYHYTLPIVDFKYFLVSSKIFKIKLTASEFRMYLYCCKCADSRTMQFWNSFNDICNQLNLHRSSVIATLKSLIKKGLISRYRVKKGSIINVGVRKIEPTKKYKKVEHKFEKSVKMELTKKQNGGQNYALHLFYRKTNRIARHNNK